MNLTRNTLNKSERLYLRKEISELFLSKKAFTIFPFKVLYINVDSEFENPAKILISVPKRFVKKAVDRNLIKRRTREAYRKNKHILYDFLNQNNLKLNIAIIYLHKEIADYTTIESKIILTLRRLIEKHEENN